MVTKKPEYGQGAYTSNFKKRPAWDIFDVYNEKPRAKQATAEMKSVCDRFLAEHRKVSIKYRNEGLDDSASREMTIRYILEHLEPWLKTRRLREERGLKPLPARR